MNSLPPILDFFWISGPLCNSMSSPNADLIAVCLACPKDPTSPYRMHMGPPRESSVRNLLENVGNLRDIAVLVQLNLAFLTFIDLHLQSNCLGLSTSIYKWVFWIWNKIIFECKCGPVFSRSSKNGLLKNLFGFWSDFDETWCSCSTHGHNNFTKFYQNRIKNQKDFLIAHFLNS